MSLSPRQQDQLVFYALGLMAVLFMLTIICSTPADAAEIPGQTPHAYEVEDWSLLVSRYWQGRDFDRAMSIMACESGGDPTAVSFTDDHGLFQHNAYWSARDHRFEQVGYTWADRYNPEANAAAAHWLWSQRGWAAWTCNRQVGSHDWFEPVTVDLLADPSRAR